MARFHASYDGIDEMLTAPFMLAAMEKHAKAAKAIAESRAPVYEQGPHPGRYRDSFYTKPEVRRTGLSRRPRAVGVLGNSAPEAFWVEFGTRNNPKLRLLLRSMEEARAF